MKITPGELYFVGEEDLINGTLTPLVKIGHVREKEDRTSEERAREHQTGNPRHLRVLHAQPSPAVREIEKVLHAEFAPRRIGGEWFHLPGADLEMAIERATGTRMPGGIVLLEAAPLLPEVGSPPRAGVPLARSQLACRSSAFWLPSGDVDTLLSTAAASSAAKRASVRGVNVLSWLAPGGSTPGGVAVSGAAPPRLVACCSVGSGGWYTASPGERAIGGSTPASGAPV